MLYNYVININSIIQTKKSEEKNCRLKEASLLHNSPRDFTHSFKHNGPYDFPFIKVKERH
jgi:hypothetical protein